MSDDEYDSYDDDDYFWIDEGPVAEADELAAQTTQSPVYEVPLEIAEGYSDWEDYPDWDEYYDHPSQAPGQKYTGEKGLGSGMKRKAAGQASKTRKRRKLMSTEEIPEFSLSEAIEEPEKLCSPNSIVVWKTDATFAPRPLPVVGDMHGEQVALLKDWGERFRPPYKYPLGTAKVSEESSSNMAWKDIDTATGDKTKQSPQGKSKIPHRSISRRKRPADSSKNTTSHPRKKTLSSLAAASSENHPPSNAPTMPSRKRKAQNPPESDESPPPAPQLPAPTNKLPPRMPIAVNPAAPLRKSASRNQNALALAEHKENSAPAMAADGEGAATRRSKRLKEA